MKRVVLTALLGCVACGGSPAGDREVRLRRLEAEHRALTAQLDDLQARLLVGGQQVRFWEEMRTRHESVSAIAVATQDAHAVAMAQHLERSQPGIRRTPGPKLRQARVAAIRPAMGGPEPTPASTAKPASRDSVKPRR